MTKSCVSRQEPPNRAANLIKIFPLLSLLPLPRRLCFRGQFVRLSFWSGFDSRHVSANLAKMLRDAFDVEVDIAFGPEIILCLVLCPWPH